MSSSSYSYSGGSSSSNYSSSSGSSSSSSSYVNPSSSSASGSVEIVVIEHNPYLTYRNTLIPCPDCTPYPGYDATSCSDSTHTKGIIAVLVNYGDDNGNGQEDSKDPEYPNYNPMNDSDVEEITLSWHANCSLIGCTPTLTVTQNPDANIKIWKDSQRVNPFSGFEPIQAGENSRKIYVEGIKVGSGSLELKLQIPGGPEVNDIRRYQVVKPYWKGFVIPERWQTDKMEDVIKVDDTYYANVSGSAIRTPFPNAKKDYPPVPDPPAPPDPRTKSQDAAKEAGASAKSLEKYMGNFDITVNFDLVGNHYIHAIHSTDPSPSFFRNSGIYIYGAYEIQIFDTAALMEYVDRIDEYKVMHTPGVDFKFALGTASEPENRCVSGVPYKRNPSGYGQMSNDPNRYDFDVVKNWIQESGNVMTIKVRPIVPRTMLPISREVNGVDVHHDVPEIHVEVELNGITTWKGNPAIVIPENPPNPAVKEPTGKNEWNIEEGHIWLQAHWGSGVKFTDVVISTENLDPIII